MNVITIDDKKYPELLKEIGKDAPKQIYYKENYNEDIFTNCLAVVGSRQMTSYGKRVVEQIVTEVSASSITIVSGFMYGVDATAHKAALLAGGRTIAVMPCGIDLIHPEYQQDLYAEILNNQGLVISEYEGSFAPTLWTYPRRNRIVAGLSKAVLVIEAGEKSGSLITANWAKKFKRKIFVVPGPITSENSKGIMELLKDGATPVSSAEEILREYKFSGALSTKLSQSESEGKEEDGILFAPKGPYATQKIQGSRLDGIEQKIMDLLKRESAEIDVLTRIFEMPVSKLGVTLSLMQLRGLIKQEGNKFYIC